MHATDAGASRLMQWAARQKEAAARYVSLHDTLFGVHKYQYFLYRTRYVFITVLMRTAVHIAELLLVVNVMPTSVTVLMLGRLASTAVESGWWGLTESMRKRIRWLRKEGNMRAVQDEIEGWISLSVLVALLIVGVSFFIFGAVRHGNSTATSALAMVIALQTAARIVNRTFYSGAYAIRRVFLPIEMIIFPELVITAAGFLLYDPLGEWAAVLCLAAATVVGTLVHYIYVRAVSDFLRITPRNVFSTHAFLGLFRHHSGLVMLLSAAASLCMRLLEIGLIVTIQIMAKKQPNLDHILYPLYITMPLIRSAATWGQLTYFDLTKYGLDCIHEFRNKFERLCLEFSFLLSLMFCVLAAILIVMFSADYIPQALLVILPHIVVSAMFGFVLVALFSRYQYVKVTLLCCMQYGIFLWLMLHRSLDVPLWLILVYASLVPLILGWLALLPSWQAPESALRSFSKWLSYVRGASEPLLLYRITLDGRISGVLRRRFIKLLLTHIRSGDLVTTLPSRQILLSMPLAHADETMSKSRLIELGGGLITDIAMLRTGNAAAMNAFIGSGATLDKLDEQKRLDALVAYFTSSFPEGLVQYPLRPQAQLIEATDSEERRTILHAARAQLEGGKPPVSARWHVDIGIVAGSIACIFLLPRQVPVDRLKAWRRILLADFMTIGG